MVVFWGSSLGELLITEFSNNSNGISRCWLWWELVTYKSGRKESFNCKWYCNSNRISITGIIMMHQQSCLRHYPETNICRCAALLFLRSKNIFPMYRCYFTQLPLEVVREQWKCCMFAWKVCLKSNLVQHPQNKNVFPMYRCTYSNALNISC